MGAQEIRQGVERLLVDLGYAPIAEFTLKNNRRADLIALSNKGAFVIIEIKSSLADFRSDHKWREYLDYADRYYFAVDREFPREVLPEEEGLIIADAFGGAILREGPERPLAPARRRAVLLRFARHAALRLAGVNDNTGYVF